MSEPDLTSSNNLPVNTGSQPPFQSAQGASKDQPAIAAAPKSSRILLLLLAAAIVVSLSVIALTRVHFSSSKDSAQSDDMGAGIANASGLRGHLVTRWQGKTQYMLKIEPLDPRDAAGFATVTANPTRPISIYVRLLDSAGFALCGKEIALRYDPARASRPNSPLPKKQADADRVLAEQQANLQRASQQESAREQGKDIFQNIQGSDGAVEALWAQGELPCSPDQYKKFDYWDLSTNFPTLAEQDVLLGHIHPGAPSPQTIAEIRASEKRKLAAKKPVSTFYIEGDDRVTAYEPSKDLLITPGRSFLIPSKNDQAVVAEWATDSTLIHFKCDQQSNCSLRTGSRPNPIYGKVSE